MRKRGSARFDPYYKVQWYDAVTCAWRDIQRPYPDEETARAAYLPDRTCRLMRITMQGRAPLPETVSPSPR